MMYAWEVAPEGDGGLPLVTGVTGELADALRHAGAALITSDGAVLAMVEAVRPSPWRTAAYQRAGLAWLGRQAGDGGVLWGEIPFPEAGR